MYTYHTSKHSKHPIYTPYTPHICPNYTPLHDRYRTYNVTSLLKPGEKNVLAVWASAGWGAYGDLNHGIAKSAPLLLVKMTAGSNFSLVSDATWKVKKTLSTSVNPS